MLYKIKICSVVTIKNVSKTVKVTTSNFIYFDKQKLKKSTDKI